MIAVMLGPLHMTADEAIEHFQEFAHEVFGKPQLRHLFGRTKYSIRRLRDFLDKMVNGYALGEMSSFTGGDDRCRTYAAQSLIPKDNCS